MILVNTTVVTTASQLPEVTSSIRATYFKAACDAGFTHVTLCRILSHQEPGQASLAVQFQAPSSAIADAWMEVEGRPTLMKLTGSFPPESVLYFTTSMGVLARDNQ